MTTLLQRAVAEAEKLPAEDQDGIASRFLAEGVSHVIPHYLEIAKFLTAIEQASSPRPAP